MNVSNWLTGRFAGQVSESMAEAVNAVKKQGHKGYLAIAYDEQAVPQVVMHKRRHGTVQQIRMPAVEQLLAMVDAPTKDVVRFLADETHCAYSAHVDNFVD